MSPAAHLAPLLIVAAVAGCYSTPSIEPQQEVTPAPAPEPATPGPFEVELQLVIIGAAGGKPTLRGTTNLPDDTKLMTSIWCGPEGGSADFFAQGEVAVVEGAYTVGPFSDKGNPIRVSTPCKASVTMPIPAVQSQAVQEVIGAKGENLTGRLVENGDFGVTVEVEVPIKFGG